MPGARPGLGIEKGAVAAAAVDYVKLSLLIENGGVVAGNERVRQYQVAVCSRPMVKACA